MNKLTDNQILAICTVDCIVAAIICVCYGLHTLQP